jgi:hypothetical protein
MEKQAFQILVHEYKMRLSNANGPQVTVVLDKSSTGQERFVEELLSASPEAHLEVSTDPLINSDAGTRSVVVSVVSKTIPPSLERHMAPRSLWTLQETVCVILAMSYQYQAHAAEHFYQDCSAWTGLGREIPVTVFNSRGNFLGKCGVKTVGRFSWKEKLEELQRIANQTSLD